MSDDDHDPKHTHPQAETAEALGAALVVLRTRVDKHAADAHARTPAAFSCREGCDACCHRRFGVFEIEANRLRGALARLAARAPSVRARVRAQALDPAQAEHCSLLVDGRCAVYDERPMICRAHGLPLGWVETDVSPAGRDGETQQGRDGPDDTVVFADSHLSPEPVLRIDVCPLNFRDQEIPMASVLRLEAVDGPLAVMAELWDGGRRVDLATLAAAPDAPAR